MEYLFVYLLQVADIWQALVTICIVLAVCSIIIFGMWIGFMIQEDVSLTPENNEEDWKKSVCGAFYVIKNIVIALIAVSIVGSFIPTKQTLLLIGGTYLAKRTVNSSVVNDKLEKINTVIDLQLDKYIKELNGGTNE